MHPKVAFAALLLSGTLVVGPLFELAMLVDRDSAAEEGAVTASARIIATVIVERKQIGTVEFPTLESGFTSTTLIVSHRLRTGNTIAVRYLPDDPSQVWEEGGTPPSASTWWTGPLIPIGVLGAIAAFKRLNRTY